MPSRAAMVPLKGREDRGPFGSKGTIMANTNAPNGFQFWGKMEGASPTVGLTVRKAESSANAIGFGDPVTSGTGGYITISTAGTTQIAGIFYGCEYFSSAIGRSVWSPNWPGSGATGDVTCYLDTDPNSMYVAQSNNTAITFADINANINFVVGTPATTAAGGFSTSSLDQSTINTTNTLPFRVVGLLTDYVPAGSVNGTDNSSAYNRVIVRANYWDRTSLVGMAS